MTNPIPSGSARLDATAAADAEATHWRRLGMAPPTSIAALDVPLPVVESQARQLAGGIAEQAHLLDPADPLFVRLACEHGDCCSTDDDYPNWTPGGQA